MKYKFYSKKIILILLFIFLIYNTFINNIFLKKEKFSKSLFQNLDVFPAPTEYNTKGLSPHILKITINGTSITIYLKKNIRDIDILNPKEISVYEIYFKRKDHLHLTCPEPSSPEPSSPEPSSPEPSSPEPSSPEPSSPEPSSPEPSSPLYEYDNTFLYEKRNINLDDWNRLVVHCKSDNICKINMTHSYFNTDKEYIFFAIKKNNNKKSYIENLIIVSNKKPFPINISKNINQKMTNEEKQILFNIEQECDNYTFNECPTNITGTILSKCYQDKSSKRCKNIFKD